MTIREPSQGTTAPQRRPIIIAPALAGARARLAVVVGPTLLRAVAERAALGVRAGDFDELL